MWDEETSLYYLRSRYYNPEWGRFIIGDILIGKVGSLLAHNGFVYCANTPIHRIDSDGKAYSSKQVLEYASKWWNQTRESFNARYGFLESNCANFVSQCLYEGGLRKGFKTTFTWNNFNIPLRGPRGTDQWIKADNLHRMLRDDYGFPSVTIKTRDELREAIREGAIRAGQPAFNMKLNDTTVAEHAFIIGSVTDESVGYYGSTHNRTADQSVRGTDDYGDLEVNLLDAGYSVVVFNIPEGA